MISTMIINSILVAYLILKLNFNLFAKTKNYVFMLYGIMQVLTIYITNYLYHSIHNLSTSAINYPISS